MRCVVQRVTEAAVRIGGEVVGQTGKGFLLLIGVEVGDKDEDLDYIARKVPNLRIFEDENGKMNRSLLDVGGDILAVSQFTLLGDAGADGGPALSRRPAEVADPMYEALVERWRSEGVHVETGRFGAEMKVSLVNDGPVTILLDSRKIL